MLRGWCRLRAPRRRRVDSRMSAKPSTRQLRAIGHHLKPVVTIAGNGLTETVSAELERALTDHELIKVKLAVGSREIRDTLIEQILEERSATLVQRVGNTALLLRRSTQPDPRKSNLLRAI
ncbi:MAG: RNA-binding protein [Halieaceae bacterium]